jgi:hypothetical protein
MSVSLTANGHFLGTKPINIAGSGLETSFPFPKILLGK